MLELLYAKEKIWALCVQADTWSLQALPEWYLSHKSSSLQEYLNLRATLPLTHPKVENRQISGFYLMLWGGKPHKTICTRSDLPWWHSEKETAWEWNVRPSIKKQTIEYFMFEGNSVFCHLYLGKGKQQKMQLYTLC